MGRAFVLLLRKPARENVELTTLYLLTPGNGCKKVSSAFCLSCIPPLRYREIRQSCLARLFFPPPPPPPFFLPRNSLSSSLFPLPLPFLFLDREKEEERRTRGCLLSSFFFSFLSLKGEVSEVSEEGIRTPRTLRLRHLPFPPSPLPAKGRIPIGSPE